MMIRTEVVTSEGFYRLRDPYPSPGGLNMIELTKWRRNLRARWTGEFRRPKPGEWFLSGAIVEAYQAPTNWVMDGEYPIAKIVRVEEETIVREVGEP